MTLSSDFLIFSYKLNLSIPNIKNENLRAWWGTTEQTYVGLGVVIAKEFNLERVNDSRS
jgi:hypothetical protein